MAKMEIERKFIIRKPAILPQLRVVDIKQTYLRADGGTRRVRQVTSGSEKEYYFTGKIRYSDLSCLEDERKLDETEYLQLLQQADDTRQPIQKKRYYYPYQHLTFEIDVYPFWQRQCVMEVELSDEQQPIEFPPDIEIIAEVSQDKRYKNAALARRVPEEMI